MAKYELSDLIEMSDLELRQISENLGFIPDNKTQGGMIGLILEIQ